MTEIKKLTKRLSPTFCIDIDRLVIGDGITALIGPNGSGKSTLLRLVSGQMKPDGGKIESKAENMGYMPQFPYAFRGTVDSNLAIVCKSRSKRIEILRLCGLGDKIGANTLTLSGGEKQRMFIARMLAGDFGMLLLDEPTSALDVESAGIIRNALTAYSRERNVPVVLSTHSPAEAKGIADEIIMMNEGRAAEHGTPADILINPGTEWGKKFISQWKLD